MRRRCWTTRETSSRVSLNPGEIKAVEASSKGVKVMQEGLLWFDADPKRDLAEKVLPNLEIEK